MASKPPIATALSSFSIRSCSSLRKEYFFTFESTASVTEPSFHISCTVADMNAINIVAKTTEEEEEEDEDEEEEFVKYGAVDEFYDLEKEIGK